MSGARHHSSASPAASQTSSFRSFLRLVSMLKPFRGRVIASIVIAWAITGGKVAVPWITGRIIDFMRHHQYDRIDEEVWKLIGISFVVAVLSGTRRVTAGTISLGLEKTLRDRLFGHLSHLNFSFFDRQQTGQLLSRVTVDVTQVRFFLGYGLPYFFMNFTQIIVIPIILVIVEPAMALIALSMIPMIYAVSMRYSRKSNPVMREIQQREADATTAAEENIIGARVVRAFGQEDREVERYKTFTARIVDKERESWNIKAKFAPLYSIIPNIALAVVVLLSARAIDSGSMTLGEFFAFYGYLLMLTGPARIIGNLLGRAQRATASSERLFELLDATDTLPVKEFPTPMTNSDRAATIELDHVNFAYREGAIVVSDVALTIPSGSTVALLGPTGCGKTTLTSLVPRFYDPDSGIVRIDGIDVRDLDLTELRRTVGIVNQEPFLFSATIADNLRFGNENATDEDLWHALQQAQATEFVHRLPEQLETLIGERGLTLSGGQRQRLAIARALVVNPRILILDDATASVDSRVESQITKALHSATQGRTTILIAHRPSTIALADSIVIMDRGAIVDSGTHEELIIRNALYQQIHSQTTTRREFLLAPDLIEEDYEDGVPV